MSRPDVADVVRLAAELGLDPADPVVRSTCAALVANLRDRAPANVVAGDLDDFRCPHCSGRIDMDEWSDGFPIAPTRRRS